MVTIGTFNEPEKAKRLKQRLQESGVKADIHNERHLQQMAFMSRPQANAKVMVDDDDFERVQNLMIEWETSDPVVGAVIIRCLHSNFSGLEYSKITRKTIMRTFVMLFCMLGILPKKFYVLVFFII